MAVYLRAFVQFQLCIAVVVYETDQVQSKFV